MPSRWSTANRCLRCVPREKRNRSESFSLRVIQIFVGHGFTWLRKNSQQVIPKGWIRPRNLLFLGVGEEKQIPRFARDDKKALFPQPVKPFLLYEASCVTRNSITAR